MKLSDYVFQFLQARGVRHVFMLPGGGSMHLVDSLGRAQGLAFVPTLHEQAAAIAAEAYGRATNSLGVAMVTGGPGGTNTLTGVAGAWLASSPLLVISGQAKRSDLKGGSGARQIGGIRSGESSGFGKTCKPSASSRLSGWIAAPANLCSVRHESARRARRMPGTTPHL